MEQPGCEDGDFGGDDGDGDGDDGDGGDGDDDGDGDGDDGGYFDGSAVRVDGLQGRRLADCKMRKSGERVTRYLDNNQVIRDQVIRDQMIRK